MGTPDDDQTDYKHDSRIPCKYGSKCYQKNEDHHKKYKHPPRKRENHENGLENHNKRQKQRSASPEARVHCNDVSESSEEEKGNKGGEESVGESNNERDNNEPKKRPTTPEVQKHCNDVSESSDEETQPNSPLKAKGAGLLKTKDTASPKASLSPQVVLHKQSFNKKEFIKKKFLFDMPEDFYQFWEFCKRLNGKSPCTALKDSGLLLVGPYDVLANKFLGSEEKSVETYLLHWRFFHDPPEFQTVIKGDDKSGFHIGYFRDSPSKKPVFLAANSAMKGGEFSVMGENIFAAVSIHLEELKKMANPFMKLGISNVACSVKAEAENLGLSLSQRTSKIRERSLKIVTRSFNKIGLVVPYDKKTEVGYRELAASDKDLRKLLDRLSTASPEHIDKIHAELQPVLNFANIAIDECDFGTGIELGWNIIAHGVDSLNSTVAHFLTTAYNLLDKPEFAKIAEAHMSNRKKGTDLSIL